MACNLAHSADSRLARWLLMTQDRIGADSFDLTQDYMAVMTGVQRTTVSTIAAGMKRDGLIDYSRGRLVISDREGLIAQACECYRPAEEEFELLRAQT